MPRIGPLKGACRLFDSAVRSARARRGVPLGYDAIRRHTTQNLARTGSVEDISRMQILEAARRSSAEGRLERLSRSAAFQFSAFDIDDLRFNWRDNLKGDGKRVFDQRASPAILNLQLSLQQHSGFLGRGFVLSKRGRKSGVPSWLVAAVNNFAPSSELYAAAKLPSGPARRKAYVAAMRKTHVGVSEMNKADILTFGFRDYPQFFKMLDDGISELTPTQIDVIADAYAFQMDLYTTNRASVLATFRQEFPIRAASMTEEDILAELGIGPTLFSYYTHVFNHSWESGYSDYLMEMATGSGLFNHNMVAPHVANQDMTLAGIIRGIGGKTNPDGTLVTPFRVGARTATTPEEALRLAFPGIRAQGAEAERINLHFIRRAAEAADDTGVFQARNPRLWNQYLLDRHGMQGFITDYWTSFEAYTHAASRQIHLDPLFAPAGPVNTFVTELGASDLAAATDFSNHVRQLIGLAPMNDAAFRDFAGYSHVIAGNAYAAIARLNPGLSLPNVLSWLMYTIPEAMRDGYAAGGRDLFASLFMLNDSAFKRILRHTELANTYTFARESSLIGFFKRSWEAAEAGDIRGAARLAKEAAVTYSDILSFTEARLVRPIGAALGAARYLRRNNLLSAASLTPQQTHEMMLEMIRVVEKSTILGATSNAIPALQFVRGIPVVGPLASMFTSTPINIASHMFTNFKTMLTGPPELRGEALRIFSTQATMGTLAAGPFWFFPWLREIESTEDREEVLGALNAWERYGSLAGWLGTDLSRRLSPIAGITDRFLDERSGIAGLVFGPLGGAVNDIIAAAGFTGDDAARRRAAGAFAPLLFDLPPSGVLPSAAQVLLPAGGVGIEKLLRVALSTHADPRGYLSLGPLGLPVKNPSGYKVDSLGRPYATTSPGKEFRRFTFGGRDILDAIDAAEGIRSEKRTEHRHSVESRLRRTILDGDFDRALRLYEDNADLQPVITETELERESLMRQLPAEARAVFSGQLLDVAPRIRRAVERLTAGGLSPEQEKEERAIAVIGIMKLSRARPKTDVVLGPPGAP